MTLEEQSVAAKRLVQRSRSSATAFRQAARVVHVLRVMVPNDGEVNKLVAAREDLEKLFERLSTFEPGRPEFERELSGVESALHHLEKQVMALDATIPMGWFRRAFDPTKFTSESLADYASLLGRYAGDDPARLDRAQLLLTRLVISFLGGKAADLQGADLRSLLAEALPPSTLEPAARENAREFFRDATARIDAFKSLAELTSSSFFLDVRGFKQALRKGVLDPDVMAGAIETNQRVTEAVDRLARTEAPGGVSLEEHLKEVDARIRAVFQSLRTDDSAEVQRFEKRLTEQQPKAAAPPSTPGVSFFPKIQPHLVYRYVTIALSVVIAFALVYRSRGDKDAADLSLNATLGISQLLVTASVQPSPPARPRILVGRIDRRKWAAMNTAQRFDAAHQLLQQIGAQGIIAATVMQDDGVAIQIEGGQVLLVH